MVVSPAVSTTRLGTSKWNITRSVMTTSMPLALGNLTAEESGKGLGIVEV